MFRVRVSSFFAGAAAASVAGVYLLYKDYKVAHDSIFRQVRDTSQSFDERYEALDKRITALEKQKEVQNVNIVETAKEEF
ncbi:hypothetical protein J5N97_025561 [Dioscorea zingiberensis]|uniref:Uncharacterized protein n=1 Tax=Dioscorea zingiberensis TaxID=325984 RepID=A0A9D5H9R9_9LILI|nr:hypothetical protein J5N97_025561 [Dioscorea zingiberensis]